MLVPAMRTRCRIPCGALLATALLAGLSGCASRVAAPPASLEERVRRLASEDFAGRMTGSEGERRAADYLVQELERLGASPLSGRGFRLTFGFAAGTRDAGSSLLLEPAAGGAPAPRFAAPSQVRALSFSSSGSVEGPLVFAGYGLVVPESLGRSYDSYAGLDVAGKIVLVLRYFPEDLPAKERQLLSRYAGLRTKAMLARERGARALLVAAGPRSPHAGEVVPMTFDAAVSGSGIAAASVSGEVAEALFAGAPVPLAELQAALDAGDPHARGFELPGFALRLETRLEREHREAINVVGVLPASGEPAPRPWVIVGAHYDHLGSGAHGNSLAREEERGALHPGADDNASGVAAVLRIGELLTREPARRRNVLLAFWSGEELGLLGSTAFGESGALEPGQIAGVLNLDMVGRVRANRLALQAVGTSPDWPALLERANAPVGLDLELQEDPYLPTDSASFDRLDVPTLNLFSGAHADYHRPSDTPDRIEYAGLERVAQLGARIAGELAALPTPPTFARAPRRSGPAAGRDSLRAYTGTVPDYVADVEGLALASVASGGPADLAGLRAGDVIVEFAGQQIANIYDYTYALEAARIGEPVRVVYLRGGERREASITPRER